MPSNSKSMIAPIALDVGAKNTGVFRAIYECGTSIEDISSRYGEVLTIDSGNYTLLMRDRTAKRHMRRGFDRRKMAKRLLLLVLRDCFDFPVDAHRQALGFLMNRRGFTRLEESFDAEALKNFPQTAWDELPDQVKGALKSREELYTNFNALINDDDGTLRKIDRCLLQDTIQPVKKHQDVLAHVKKLIAALEKRAKGQALAEGAKDKNKLSQTPAWIVTELSKCGVTTQQQDETSKGRVDLLAWINSLEETSTLSEQLAAAREKLETETATVWKNVKPGSFDLEKNSEKFTDESKQVEAHLNNLVFAIHKAAEELSSGSRHRRKYFEEIKADINNAAQHPHKYMQAFAAAIRASSVLDEDKLYRLIAHISNLELKPLRAYFNDKAHKQGDQWQAKKLAKIVSRWFLKQWRVNADKDDQKTVDRYCQLKAKWTAHQNKDDMIAFWLDTDPQLTIPPYQSQTNRRPPDCQSLILNGHYMDNHYPNWRNWLEQLDATGAPDLSGLVSSKGNPLLDNDERELRQLQYILDRAQSGDPCRLNLIWSQYHRYQKGGDAAEQAEKRLDEHLAASALPDALKNELKLTAFGKQGKFGHFLNKYYQCRRKARDGRYFLHPQNRGHLKPGKLNDQTKLLTLCHHRPRQKRHQMHMDFAAIVGLTPAELEQQLNKQTVAELLRSIRTFPTNAENAAKAQKEHRGELKLKLQQGKNKKLDGLRRRVEALAVKLAKCLWPELDEDAQKKKSERFNSLFSFAQIYNIVFKDRTGFSNTCPLCSSDNAGRMVEDGTGKALASRLPALSMRLIDGAVKRLLDYKAQEISRRHWDVIAAQLHAGHDVCVPLILEQNHFKFEPSLKQLKGKRDKPGKPIEAEDFDTKVARIKQASGDICPYSGNSLSDSGELDHIIPRASAYGTLNDEANLIYVSQAANRSRSNQMYYLRDLHNQYKLAKFNTTDDKQIRELISQVLTGKPAGTDAVFVFGNYLSFINLDADQQIAFRHALFLDDQDPLKQRVIRALDNRNRTFVNGTQRYFAQLIADKLHDRARCAKPPGKLSFDYFEYPADSRHPKGVQNLRNALGLDKQPIQEDYSHHIDAHMAFLLACDDHRGNGSMGVDFGNIASVWPFDDGDATAYKSTEVQRGTVNVIPLGRRASHTGNRPWRAYHRDNFYADRYMPLWMIFTSDGEIIKKGYAPDNAVLYQLSKEKANTVLQCIARFSSDDWMREQAGQAKDWPDFSARVKKRFDSSPAYIPWARNVIEKHCVDAYSAQSLAGGKEYGDDIKLLRELAYQTQKKTINSPEDIEKALKTDVKGKGETRKNGIDLPARSDWLRLHEAWDQAGRPMDEDFDRFLREYFLHEKNHRADETRQPSHKKARRVFSLPIYNENAHYLQLRQSVTGDAVYQLIADSDSRKDGNKFKRAAITPAGDMVEVVNEPFRSKRMFKLKQDKVYAGDDYINIDPNHWHEITRQKAGEWQLDFPEKVQSIAYRIDNVTRPKVRLQFNDGATDDLEVLLGILTSHQLTKPKETEKLKIALEHGGAYVGSGFNKAVKQALSRLFQHEGN